jgi:transcriptional regulator with XRE-family HTH domain
MGRPEGPLVSSGEALSRFAADLRRLREDAGKPTYRTLANRAGYAPSTLSEAACGRRLPSLEVTLAYVAGCGGDAAAWTQRWQQLSSPSGDEPGESAEEPPQDAARGVPRRRYALLVVAVLFSAATIWAITRPDTAYSGVFQPELVVAEGADPHDTGCDRGRLDDLSPTGLYAADRIMVGTVLLRWSRRCRMGWARFEPSPAFDKLGGGTVQIEGRRPSDGYRDRYQVQLPTGLPMWGNLIATRGGCLSAWARVTFPRPGAWATGAKPSGSPLVIEAETACVPPS